MANVDNLGITVSSRIRLARNLSDYKFPCMIRGGKDEVQVLEKVKTSLCRIGGFNFYDIKSLSDTQKKSFVERYLISQNLAKNKNGSLAISNDGVLSVMINEEDHLREQCIVKGSNLASAYKRISSFDKLLGMNLSFAKSNNFYFTACPTNLGTGMRASVMLFLPAITKSGRINEFFKYCKEQGITLRGTFGEGSKTECYYYQVSNSYTMDVTPQEIIQKVNDYVFFMIDAERDERESLLKSDSLKIEDECMRAFGILTNAKLLDYSEFYELISKIKLGVDFGFIDCKDQSLIDNLIVSSREHTLLLNDELIGSNQKQKLAIYISNNIKQIVHTK